MNRVTLAIIAFFGTALLLYWQVQSKQNAGEGKQTSSQLLPDFVATELRSVEYNDKGQVSSKVSASYMEHFQASNITEFTEPVYLIYPNEGAAQWRLSASRGKLSKNSGKVVLEQDVQIQAISQQEPLQNLSTSYLELDLNTMIMTSNRPILVFGKGFNVTGQGLYADLNAQEVKLLSQVKGSYEPK
ncbi:LPS export ABC transporter periplasmic protein LptC [Shewanella cyperi]|uniref:Lipopolysaccharide export system protein LptC n=1 Tax=Shewanella cyperi TaxID=2814292 RepID=A0A975AKT4_9GAMM|nr:LPS export ABC transporter periplasmic protein LptC [Shewanella cyperi]QSX29538.1 LPS export ABC transporter periplasmic protein LptC [Shewanella cyperi]QSX40314.1 LPS export ABC transporter periplasmic protein LptC [Shewanella cyperi]